MKRFTPFLLSLLILLTVASAREVSAKDNWISVRSRNFQLIGNAGEKDVRQVANRLEQFREVFTRLFPKAKFISPVPTTVIVFKSDKSYSPFRSNPNIAGYFQPGPDVNYITLTTEVRGEQDPFTVIFHEYTHLLVNSTLGNVPIWFNEGLAEYYSSFAISDDRKVTLGKPIGHHVYLLRESKMLPLPTLFQVDHKSPHYNERDKQSIFYAQSWALVHYLIQKPGGSDAIDKFMGLMNSNISLDDAFQQSFQTTFEKMETDIRAYIKHDSYPVTVGKFEQKVDFDTQLQVAPLSEADAQAYLGDLLLHSNRTDSEEYLKKALALDANHPMANASLAMLRVREGKMEEARSNLERAVTANSQNYLIHYYYAYALSQEGMDTSHLVSGYSPESLTKMRGELRRAIDLRPDYPESYVLLAFINLVAGSELNETITMVKKILATSPGRNDLALTLAQLYMRTEDFKSAREILERLTQNPQMRAQAQSLLAGVVDYEERLARYRAAKEARGNAATVNGGPPRLKRGGANDALASEAPGEIPLDPFAYLQEALRLPATGEKQVQGVLLRLDCDAKGIFFVVQLADRVIKLRTSKFENIQITAFTSDAGAEITCGPRQPANPVVICYLPTTDAKAKYDGDLRSVEFVPSDFKLQTKQ
ncbi:MAG TPA: tetratricopeptide repeat protein [Pyrinomonadaceae bacterium]|nr:tetratricopeptide repeat protein [Pyrinomonadaceae bacterium]